jgi:3-hydroxyisobutyrate dehydrogenase
MTLDTVAASPLKIGVLGIGAFGSRVAMRLLWSGFHNLMVYDTHEQTPRMFSGTYGGLPMGSPKMLAQMCDIVITALPSATEMRDAFFGWEGLATGFKKDGLVMDIGVTDPMATVALAKELEAHHVQLVDAPAFGAPEDAREGRLTILVGGADNAVERCQPVLEKLATRIIRAGATGSAQAAAAIADYLRAAQLLAASEAIRLGGRFGFEPANLLDVCDALGGAGMARMLRDEVASRRFKTGLQLGLLTDNVELAAKMALASESVSPMLTATRDALTRAEDRLGYSMDHSAVIKWLETLTPPKQAGGEPDTTTGPAGKPGPSSMT